MRQADADQRAEIDDSLRDAADQYSQRLQPVQRPANGQPPAGHIPGLARRDIRPPSWWKGDRAAWRSSVQAAKQLGEPAVRKLDSDRRPRIGTGR